MWGKGMEVMLTGAAGPDPPAIQPNTLARTPIASFPCPRSLAHPRGTARLPNFRILAA